VGGAELRPGNAQPVPTLGWEMSLSLSPPGFKLFLSACPCPDRAEQLHLHAGGGERPDPDDHLPAGGLVPEHRGEERGGKGALRNVG